MTLEVREWESPAALIGWLYEYPRRLGVASPELLYDIYQSGVLDDSDDVWRWAQQWANYIKANPMLAFDWMTDLMDRPQCDPPGWNMPVRETRKALGASQGFCIGLA